MCTNPQLFARRFGAALLCSILLAAPAHAQKGSLKNAWVTGPVGTVTVNGSATASPSGRVSVSGEGTDIWSTADGFQFLYQRLSGDRQIVANITGLQNTDGWAKGGLMIRQALTGSSAHAALLMTPSNGIVFERRTTAGGVTSQVTMSGAVPSWLRLARTGQSITAWVSSDGTTWTVVSTQTLTLPTDVYVGVAVTSRHPSRLTTATFEKVAISIPPTTAAAAAPPPGPVAAWSFDDGVGSRARASVGGLDGAINGAAWTTAGRYGAALVFNGVDNLVTVPTAAPLNLSSGMTLEAWVYPTLLSNWRSIAVKEGSTDLAYGLYANDGSSKPEGVINTGNGHVATLGAGTLPLNTWSHLAATFDGTTQRLLVNGLEVSSVAASGTLTQTSGSLRIGGNSLWGDWFSGAIDDVRLYDRALSTSEIQADMNTPVPPPPADTTLPVVAITSPVTGATVAGAVSVVATANDDVGVAGVQFLLNGVNMGTPVTTAPYSVAWNTASVSDGTYRLTAVARDYAGNANVSGDVTVTVSNGGLAVTNSRYVQFTSPDHFSTLPDGRATVSGYTLEVWTAGSNTTTGTPYKTSGLGKPASTTTQITVDQLAFFGTLPKAQQFFTTVTATGPGGSARSAASNTFAMQ